MANVQITGTTGLIDIDFGDYAGGGTPVISRHHKSDIIKMEKFSDHVAITFRNESVMYCVYASLGDYKIIYKVGVDTPASNDDLYTKLIALM